MRTDLISRLNHMRDLGPSEAEENFNVSSRMIDALNRGEFRRLDTPVLEPTDLFVRKSGGEVSSSLYSFQDPGGMSVSLRPEFTPSIIRWYIENPGGPICATPLPILRSGIQVRRRASGQVQTISASRRGAHRCFGR